MAEKVPTVQALIASKEGEGLPKHPRPISSGEERDGAEKSFSETIHNIPREVIDEALENGAHDAKKSRLAETMTNQVKMPVAETEAFQKLYPKMPTDLRHAIYIYASSAQRSYYFGWTHERDAKTKVKRATEQFLLYKETAFLAEFEARSAKMDAYLEMAILEGRCSDEAYLAFDDFQDEFKKELEAKYMPRAIALTKKWQV